MPLPFVIDKKTTYEEKLGRNEKCWVRTPGSGLEKRQCTLQLCLSPEDNHVKAEIIFRGTGKQIKASEKAAYHKDVAIFWQKNAWADTDVSVEWVKTTLKEGAEAAQDGDTEFVLLCDNLEAQTSDSFQDAVRNINGVVWYGPTGATDIWQPIDSGYGALMKRLIGQQQDAWLECDDNMEKWIGNQKLTASDRRVLISHWVGEANKKLQGDEYAAFRKGCFLRTGCLITADGSDDELIRPEGLPGYTVPKALRHAGPDDHLIETPQPAQDQDGMIEGEDLLEPHNSDWEESDEDDEDDWESEDENLDEYDSRHDRCFEDSLVGRRIRVLCEDDWHAGVLDYYNKKNAEFHVLFDDNEDMYVSRGAFDGISIVFI